LLRIHFSSADLARTRIGASADPFWELALSIHMLRGQPGGLLFDGWRRTTAEALRRSGVDRESRLLLSLVPTYGYFPDFLTPAAGLRGFNHGLEAIRSTPRQVLADELGRVTVTPERSREVRALAMGGSAEVTELAAAMKRYYDVAIGPHQARIDAAVARDRAARADAMASGGIDMLLARMGPWASWSSGVLRVPAHPDQEIHLDGRGLLLVPSYFCVNHPITLFDDSLEPVLVYPIERMAGAQIGVVSDASEPLGILIGRTRMAVLLEAAAGGNTRDIARRVGISAASASEHAAVLRAAGLVISYRDRNRMMHRVTRLGLALLNGG
jgi:DNA-binding transcriptional ArsR family regulator